MFLAYVLRFGKSPNIYAKKACIEYNCPFSFFNPSYIISPVRICRLVVSNNLETVFPNTVILFRIYLSMMVSNCSGERSFSKLKLLKTHLRSCMTQERLNSLSLLNIETNVFRSIDKSSLINNFALKISRKHNVYRESTEWKYPCQSAITKKMAACRSEKYFFSNLNWLQKH